MLGTGESSLINRYLILFFLAIFTGQSVADNGGSVLIKSGFIKGSDFKAFGNISKNIYSMGLVDGILLYPFYGAPKLKMEKFETCMTGMNDSQLSAIFDKYLAEHPERWHQSMHRLAFVALKEACSS